MNRERNEFWWGTTTWPKHSSNRSKSAKQQSKNMKKIYKGIRTAREEIFESRYLSSWGGNASAPDGETEKGKSEGMVRGTQKATDMWGPPHVQLQNRQSITKQIQRIERIQREYRTLQKSSAGSRRNAQATFSFLLVMSPVTDEAGRQGGCSFSKPRY